MIQFFNTKVSKIEVALFAVIAKIAYFGTKV